MNNSLIVYESPLTIYIEDHATKMYLSKNGMEIKINNLSDYELILLDECLIKISNILFLQFHLICQEEINKRGLENGI